ncbi:hypothetical protein HA402_009830 [Bradysia odoriphaga]|nr:hypothetical protein HA402_009830 [Bradysia odoriphaga]
MTTIDILDDYSIMDILENSTNDDLVEHSLVNTRWQILASRVFIARIRRDGLVFSSPTDTIFSFMRVASRFATEIAEHLTTVKFFGQMTIHSMMDCSQFCDILPIYQPFEGITNVWFTIEGGLPTYNYGPGMLSALMHLAINHNRIERLYVNIDWASSHVTEWSNHIFSFIGQTDEMIRAERIVRIYCNNNTMSLELLLILDDANSLDNFSFRFIPCDLTLL